MIPTRSINPVNLTAFQSKHFRRYLAGSFFATNAIWMLRVIVGWIAWDLTESASFVGLIALLNFGPTMLAGPVFGVFIDRLDVRILTLCTQSLFMGLGLLLALLGALGWISATTLALYAAAVGVTMAAHSPTRMSLAPRLAPREDMASAISVIVTQFNITRMTGPVIGGWLIATFDAETAVVVTAGCHLPLIAALFFIQLRPRSATVSETSDFWGALMEGVGIVARDRQIRECVILTATASLFVRSALEILPLFAVGVFDKGADGLGLLTSAAGVGAILGGFAITTISHRRGLTRLSAARATILVGLVVTMLLGLTPSWTLALGLVAVMSLCLTTSGITFQILIQTRIDDNARARVMGIWASMSIGAAAVGAALLGALADWVGPSVALPLSSTVAILAVALAWLARNSSRRL